jgi:hypothetical protein
MRSRNSVVVTLISLVVLLFPVQHAQSIGRYSTTVDVGVTLGAKSGALIGVRYFILDDVALGIDLFGAAAGRILVGIGSEINYHPPIVGSYAYIGLGISFTYSTESLAMDMVRPVERSSMWALNFSLGANTWTFQMPPVVESENKNNVPTVIYGELGVSRILSLRVETDGILSLESTRRWYIPTVELGIRQGPFTPAWVK